MKNKSSHYRNGKTRYIVWSFYDELKHERKKLVLRFRKNGKKKSVRQYEVTLDGEIRIIYHIQYDPNGDLVAENYYVYDSYGILVQNEIEGSSQ